MEYYPAIKRNDILLHDITRMNLEHLSIRKKSDTKDHILHDSIHMTCPEQANLRDRK